MGKTRVKGTFSMLVVLLAWMPRARADPPPKSLPVYVSPTYQSTVTARRSAPPGSSERVVTRRFIRSLPGGETQPLSHVLATQPGIVSDTFGFGLHVRGADGGLLYVLDGIPLPAAPLGQWGSAVDFIPIRLVRGLRLMTGGFPAEYASGAGAVVDITTRRAFGGPSGEAQVSYGTYDTTHASLNYSQQTGSLSFFGGGTFESTARGLDPPAPSPILHDAMMTGSAFGRADWAVDDANRLELLASFNQSRFEIPIDPTMQPLSYPGAVRPPDSFGNPPAPFVPHDANPTDAERNVFASFAYRHDVDAGELRVAPYFRESFGSLSCDAPGSLGPTADPGSSCSDVSRDVLHGGAVFEVPFDAGGHQHWKTGAALDFAHSSVGYSAYFRDDASPRGGPDPSRTIAGGDQTDVLLGGAFLQDEIVRGRWTVLPGVRLDAEDASFLASNEPSLALLGPNARLGVTYAATEALRLHVFAGYLWQPPSTLDGPVAGRILLPELAGQVLPVDVKAEKDWSGELGATYRRGRAFQSSLTAWGRLATDQLDRVNVGSTNLIASYNFKQGRAVGAEASCKVELARRVSGFANFGWQLAQGRGIDSERFLFTPDELADDSWMMLDHVQTWTGNLGFDLHDLAQRNHLSGLVEYGSGLRTGPASNETVPGHVVFDFTLRHRFQRRLGLRPELALDVLNAFGSAYAYRLNTGYTGSAYAPLRQIDLRLAVSFARD